MLSGVLVFELGPVARENLPFRDISYLQLWQPACLAEQSYFLKGNFVREHYEEHFCEIILHLYQC